MSEIPIPRLEGLDLTEFRLARVLKKKDVKRLWPTELRYNSRYNSWRVHAVLDDGRAVPKGRVRRGAASPEDADRKGPFFLFLINYSSTRLIIAPPMCLHVGGS